jgi:hypothetical protein
MTDFRFEISDLKSQISDLRFRSFKLKGFDTSPTPTAF